MLSRHVAREEGMSLVEATIILMILFLLTAVLSPSIGDYIEDARHTKAKEDIEALGISIQRLMRDVGSCIKTDATDPCDMTNRVEILRSNGPDVVAADLGTTAAAFASGGNVTGPLNWDDDQDAGVGDTFESQLVTNAPNYNTPAESSPTGYTIGGPQAGLGWRGAYMAGPIGTDPWGKVYVANAVFLVVASDASDNAAEGGRRGGWSRDAIVLAAGPNGLYDSPFGGSANFGSERQGDDLLYVLRGDTR